MVELSIEVHLNIEQLLHHRIGRLLVLIKLVNFDCQLTKHLVLLVANVDKLIEVSNQLINYIFDFLKGILELLYSD
jgi:hypothetical protein